MLTSSQIAYLERKEIDVIRWNACIEKAENGLIYAYSYYLDAMCTNWSGLVLRDYEAVMPLPWRNKWGIKYVFTPAFIQQLGVFGNFTDVDFSGFVQKVKEQFKYGDVHFNFLNQSQLSVSKEPNYILCLNKSFENIEKKFKGDLRRNLKAAYNNNLKFDSEFIPDLVVSFFEEQYKQRLPNISSNNYQNFLSLCKYLETKGMAITRFIKNADEDLLSAGIFLIDKKRIYNVMNATGLNGRKLSANHLLLTNVIREFSNQDLLFDFEGSSLQGIKEFYLNFQPINQPYFHFHFNQLPFPINILKK